MREQLQIYDQRQSRAGAVLWGMPAVVLMIALMVASCTSTQGFNEVYSEVAGFFSLGGTVMAKWLRANSEFGHFVGYALLSLSLSGAMSRRRVFVAPLIALGFGLLMEGVQVFIPSRGASLGDMGVNVLGVVVGLGLYLLWVIYARDFIGTARARKN